MTPDMHDELLRVEEDAGLTSKSHFVESERWGALHYWLGIPATALAAIGGASVLLELSDGKKLAALASLVTAVLTALLTFLDPQKRATAHRASANAYLALRNRSRRLRTVQAVHDPDDRLLTSFNEICRDQETLNNSSPGIRRSSYEKAKKRLDAGETAYDVEPKGNER